MVSLSLIQRWRASRENLDIAEFESEAKKYDTMASVALAYMEGLKATGMVKMRESNQQIMSELLSLVKQRQKSGVATGMDIARLDAQLSNEKQLAASSRYDLQHAKLNLMNLLNLPYDTPLALQDELKTDVYGSWNLRPLSKRRSRIGRRCRRNSLGSKPQSLRIHPSRESGCRRWWRRVIMV